MADYTRTAANVLPSASAIILRACVAGATLARGNNAYLDTATNTWKLIDANAVAAGTGLSDSRGVVLNDVASGQQTDICIRDSDFTHGLTTVAIGDVIIASANAGESAPSADMATGWLGVVMGIAKSATKMNLNPIANGVAHA